MQNAGQGQFDERFDGERDESIPDSMIDAFFDGELEPGASREFFRALRNDPQASSDAYWTQEMLRTLSAPVQSPDFTRRVLIRSGIVRPWLSRESLRKLVSIRTGAAAAVVALLAAALLTQRFGPESIRGVASTEQPGSIAAVARTMERGSTNALSGMAVAIEGVGLAVQNAQTQTLGCEGPGCDPIVSPDGQTEGSPLLASRGSSDSLDDGASSPLCAGQVRTTTIIVEVRDESGSMLPLRTCAVAQMVPFDLDAPLAADPSNDADFVSGSIVSMPLAKVARVTAPEPAAALPRQAIVPNAVRTFAVLGGGRWAHPARSTHETMFDVALDGVTVDVLIIEDPAAPVSDQQAGTGDQTWSVRGAAGRLDNRVFRDRSMGGWNSPLGVPGASGLTGLNGTIDWTLPADAAAEGDDR